MSKRVYVWEFPVRLTHWLNFLSVLALVITGLYIGNPFLHAVKEDQLIMAQMRFVHFVSAYIFVASMLIRIYWFFAGNKYARLNQFIFISSERWKNLVDNTLFHLFLRRTLPHSTGHSGLAGITYSLVFIVFMVLILTGFALYAESHISGIWKLLGGWLFLFMSTGTVRLIHHASMWLIVPFVIAHIYLSVYNDLIEKNGLVMSIFSGYKTTGK